MNNRKEKMIKKSKYTNLSPNISAALAYIIFIVSGIIIATLEKEAFPRFHAFQSIVFSAIWIIILTLFSVLELSWILMQIINLGFIVLWITLIIKAYQNKKAKLPIVGNLAEGLSRKY